MNYSSPTLAELNDMNRLNPVTATFIRSYSCRVRQGKSFYVAFFAVATTVYAFVSAPHTAVIWVATWVETRDPKKQEARSKLEEERDEESNGPAGTEWPSEYSDGMEKGKHCVE